MHASYDSSCMNNIHTLPLMIVAGFSIVHYRSPVGHPLSLYNDLSLFSADSSSSPLTATAYMGDERTRASECVPSHEPPDMLYI
jgi:hypothetical protein